MSMNPLALMLGGQAISSITNSQKPQYGYFQHPSGQLFEYQKQPTSLGTATGDALGNMNNMLLLYKLLGQNKNNPGANRAQFGNIDSNTQLASPFSGLTGQLPQIQLPGLFENSNSFLPQLSGNSGTLMY